MGVPALAPAQLLELQPYGMERSTPLWFYILKEAEVMESGLRLGPVGAGIVGEVFIGLLKADSESYLTAERAWKPVLPSAAAGDFRIFWTQRQGEGPTTWQSAPFPSPAVSAAASRSGTR